MPIKFLKKVAKYILLPKCAEILIEKNSFAYLIESTPKYFYYSGGIENENKLFYVIQRSPGAGLFSNLTFVINHLAIADKLGAIPILDSFNFPNLYNEPIRENSWSKYLKNKNNFINPNAILMELISLKLLFMFFISFTELKSYIFYFSKSKEIS